MAAKKRDTTQKTSQASRAKKTPTRAGTNPDGRRKGGPKTRKVRADGLQTRARVLEAATEVFARDGFEATSLRRIAEAAGVDIATLKYHVGDKASLFVEVYQNGYEHFQQSMGPLLVRLPLARDADELVREVRAVLERGYDYLEAHEAFVRLWLFRLLEGPAEVLEAEQTLSSNVIALIEAALDILRQRGLVREVDASVLVLCLITALPTLVLGSKARPTMLGPSPLPPRERFIDFFVEVLRSMLLGPPGPSPSA